MCRVVTTVADGGMWWWYLACTGDPPINTYQQLNQYNTVTLENRQSYVNLVKIATFQDKRPVGLSKAWSWHNVTSFRSAIDGSRPEQ